MDKGISVMIFSKALEMISELESDLQILNFSTISGIYPEIYIDDILFQNPDIIFFDLIKVNDDTYAAFDTLECNNILPKHMIAVALVSIPSMTQIPLNFPIVELVTFPYDIIELG